MTLEELKALYAEKGAMEQRVTPSEQGDIVDYIPIQYGEGWFASDAAPKIVGYQPGAGGGEGGDLPVPIYSTDKQLGGFAKQEGDYVYNYDPEGNFTGRTKWNENSLKTMIKDLGPLAMGALTMGGGAGMLGNALFGLEGAAAAGAGGALAGGVNAWGNDQNVLKGALLGGASGAGAMELGDTGVKVSDAVKAYNFAQNPTLAGAANLASPYMPNVNVGDGAISLNDVLKGVGTAQALGSGDYNQIFKALTGMAKDQGKSLKTGLGPDENFSEDLIPGYFEPGGAGYEALNAGDITVSEQPQNVDALLRSLSPYEVDTGKSIFTQPEDIPEMETVGKRPTSLQDILGAPDILQPVQLDMGEQPEMTITDKRESEYVPSIRTKEIKSDIPDQITADQIDKLFPNININDILQTVTPTKTVTPGGTKTTTPGTTNTQQALANLGLGGGQQTTVQDPYAHIKLMEEMFGPEIAYKLASPAGGQNLASADLDALARLLRG